ncbi:hypothetical protein D3C85_896270 [compost metagenome]
MNFLEKDLEEIIFGADRQALDQKGLSIEGKIARQVKLGKYGILDLISVRRHHEYMSDSCFIFTIYELKKDNIGIAAFLQALGYARAVQVYIKERKPKMLFNIEIVLIGRKIDTLGSFCYLPELINHDLSNYPEGKLTRVDFFTYDYDINGVSFDMKYGYGIENPF